MGSAITTLLCYLTITVISYALGQKYYNIPYNIISALGYIGLAILLVAVALSYPFGEETITSYAFQLVLLLVYLIIVFLVEKKNLNFNKNTRSV
jgi:hypothetical protein